MIRGTGICSGSPWIDVSLVGKLKERDAADKHGKLTGDNCIVKQYKYDIRRSIKMAKQRYRGKVEEQISGSGMRRMWQGLLTITDYKKIARHVADNNTTLLDELNIFFSCFEQNDSSLPREKEPLRTMRATY